MVEKIGCNLGGLKRLKMLFNRVFQFGMPNEMSSSSLEYTWVVLKRLSNWVFWFGMSNEMSSFQVFFGRTLGVFSLDQIGWSSKVKKALQLGPFNLISQNDMSMNSQHDHVLDWHIGICFTLRPTLDEGRGSNFLGTNLDSFEAN